MEWVEIVRQSPPSGGKATYDSILTTIPLKESHNQVALVLGQLSIDYTVEPQQDYGSHWLSVSPMLQPFQKWNNWVRTSGDDGYRANVYFMTRFYWAGHFGDASQAYDLNSGASARTCGTNTPMPGTGGLPPPANIPLNNRWQKDPLNKFDARAHVQIVIHDCNGFCGLPPWQG